jgi:hypothetical protein
MLTTTVASPLIIALDPQGQGVDDEGHGATREQLCRLPDTHLKDVERTFRLTLACHSDRQRGSKC